MPVYGIWSINTHYMAGIVPQAVDTDGADTQFVPASRGNLPASVWGKAAPLHRAMALKTHADEQMSTIAVCIC